MTTVNQRHHPRVSVELPVTITPPDGGILRAATIDLSITGLQLRLDATAMRRLSPGSWPPSPPLGELYQARLALGADETAVGVTFRSRVVSVRRVAQDEFRIGLLFTTLTEADRAALERYLAEHGGVS